MSRGLMWFREDLRVEDNTALTVACDENASVLAVYLIDHAMWKAHDIADCRVEFILRNLIELQSALKQKNIELLVIELSCSDQLMRVLEELIRFYGIDALYFNDQYELNELRRDKKIQEALSIATHHFTDQCIFQPQQLLTLGKTPYTIFTPYKRNFLQQAAHSPNLVPLSTLKTLDASTLPEFLAPIAWHEQGIILHSSVPEKLSAYESSVPAEYWPGGEIAAHRRLQQFAQEKIHFYQEKRDVPAYKATSKISAYLANGVLSPRQCFSAAIQANNGRLQAGEPGIDVWISELVWREFYKQIITNFPRVSMHRPFKEETDQWPWQHNKSIFEAWTHAQTGYPLIDAAMRQLQQTGWMHNRLRMVVAMFLTKDCFIDWRWGEKYFMQNLVDGDLAANNGGWQWAASTGCDAVPYFRVFNPVRQSERFDPEGIFIKQYCPELSHVPAKKIHDPFKLPAGLNYPAPIVDYRNTREFLRSTLGKE